MSILRKLQVEDSGIEGLLDVALLVRRAGLEHLVSEPSPVEVAVLAQAGEIIAHERAELVAKAITSPLEFAALMDGGQKLMDHVVDAGLAKVIARRTPRAAQL